MASAARKSIALPGEAKPRACFKPLKTVSWNATNHFLQENDGTLVLSGCTLRTDTGFFGLFPSPDKLQAFLSEYNAKNKKSLVGTMEFITAKDFPKANKEIHEAAKAGDDGEGGPKPKKTIMREAYWVHKNGQDVERLQGVGGVQSAMAHLNAQDPISQAADGLDPNKSRMFIVGEKQISVTDNNGNALEATVIAVRPSNDNTNGDLGKWIGTFQPGVLMTDNPAALAAKCIPIQPIVKEAEEAAAAKRALREAKRKQPPVPRGSKRKAPDSGLDPKASSPPPLHTSSAQDMPDLSF